MIVNPVYMFGPWDWKPSSGRMILEVGAVWRSSRRRGETTSPTCATWRREFLTAAERGKTGRRYILGGEPLSYFEAWRMIAAWPACAAPAKGSLAGAICRRAGRRPVGIHPRRRRRRQQRRRGDVTAGAPLFLFSRGRRARLSPAPCERGNRSRMEMVRRPRLRRARK